MISDAHVDDAAPALDPFFRWIAHLRSGVGTTLMRRMAAADHAAFGEFYDLTSARVYTIVRSVLVDPELSEELTAEIFLEFWKTASVHADEFEPMRSVVLFARYRAEERRDALNDAG